MKFPSLKSKASNFLLSLPIIYRARVHHVESLLLLPLYSICTLHRKRSTRRWGRASFYIFACLFFYIIFIVLSSMMLSPYKFHVKLMIYVWHNHQLWRRKQRTDKNYRDKTSAVLSVHVRTFNSIFIDIVFFSQPGKMCLITKIQN